MWFWLTATAKAHAVPETIAAKRHQWIAQGKDQQLRSQCRVAQRYVVEDAAPPTVVWLLETDDRDAVTLILDHFSDLWNIDVRRVSPQPLGQGAAGSRHAA